MRFFEALSSQAQPFIAQQLDPLTDQERTMARNLFTSEGAPCLKCHMTGDPKHDAKATAPNFTVAKERLKPGWTKRWMLDPALMSPGTAMPQRPVPHGGRALRFRRSHAGEFQRVSQGSRGSAGPLHVPVHTGRIRRGCAAAQARGIRELKEGRQAMKKIWMGAVLAGSAGTGRLRRR